MNHSFLQLVSDDLRRRFGNDLSRVAIVFPNKRAGIFFNDCLVQEGGSEPVWAPRYLTIGEVFDALTALRPVDEVKAVCRLFRIYGDVLGHASLTLDYFYGWGQQLLHDFSNIDRCVDDVEKFFGLWSAVRQLEQLPDEQQEYLNHFFGLKRHKGRQHDDFERIWTHLYDIYVQLNESLLADGEAYEGARQRDAISRLSGGEAHLSEDYETIVFVGFNILLPVEWQLFHELKARGNALFYWDYDRLYTVPDAPLSFDRGMLKNLEAFPQSLPEEMFDRLRHHGPIRFVSAASDNAQVQYAAKWLRSHMEQKEQLTAVVLADERLLQPMVYAIPQNVREVNITKGFPMNHTPAYAFVSQYAPESSPSVPVYLQSLSDAVKAQALQVGQRLESRSWVGQLTAESYFQCFAAIERLRALTDEGIGTMSLRAVQALLRQILSGLSVPFHGEPATGLQVMGVLETRNIDFRHLLVLSVGEGILPRNSADRSFVPYDLRKHYHIMTHDEQSEAYAYNFFRLLQRADDVTLVYNTATDGLHQGEPSRFLRQLLSQTEIPIVHESIVQRQRVDASEPVGLGEERSRQLMGGKLRLSPTAMESYMQCPMKFYFEKMAGLKEIVRAEDILPANTFGSILHYAAENIYRDFYPQQQPDGSWLRAEELRTLAANFIRLQKYLSAAFRAVSQEDEKSDGEPVLGLRYRPQNHRIESFVLHKYLQNLLLYDARHLSDGERMGILSTENRAEALLDADTLVYGQIDRTDRVAGQGREDVRIVDYKTGGWTADKMQASSMESLFKGNKNYVFQTMMYSLITLLQGSGKQASTLTLKDTDTIPVAALYFTQKLRSGDFSPYVKFTAPQKKVMEDLSGLTRGELMERFTEELRLFVEQMRSQPLSFAAPSQKCDYCAFQLLCGRKD